MYTFRWNRNLLISEVYICYQLNLKIETQIYCIDVCLSKNSNHSRNPNKIKHPCSVSDIFINHKVDQHLKVFLNYENRVSAIQNFLIIVIFLFRKKNISNTFAWVYWFKEQTCFEVRNQLVNKLLTSLVLMWEIFSEIKF